MPNTIDKFDGKYRFLSNFFPHEITFQGIVYPTLEHAYQASKTLRVAEKMYIADSATPAIAKRRGRDITLRSDWDEYKLNLMYYLLKKKFSDHTLRIKLLSTGTARLVEGNWWGDTYWGVCKGEGNNYLGKLLMKIRNDLRRSLGEK